MPWVTHCLRFLCSPTGWTCRSTSKHSRRGSLYLHLLKNIFFVVSRSYFAHLIVCPPPLLVLKGSLKDLHFAKPFDTCCFFNKVKGDHHLQSNVPLYNVRIPVLKGIHDHWKTGELGTGKLGQPSLLGRFFFLMYLGSPELVCWIGGFGGVVRWSLQRRNACWQAQPS